ncbi:MAG: glycosyltransferase [Alloprevotella sp.]|nr:glycosyltransferase [Alloprevotella sp.]
MRYSFIVPVFNRPDEVDELLESLCAQSVRDFECIVVEDGSSQPCEDVVARYADRLPVRYYRKENGGPGPARNYGAERARGEWLLILDSDIVLPPAYLEEVERELRREDADAFGGPDRAHPDFSPVQKAISYAMTSFLTTGGIRGGRKARLDKFYPRSFNMGVRRQAYQALGGFAAMRFGEDIDLSTRILRGGYRCRLFPGAWVWHKRRTDLRKFFKQVHNSGIARIHLTLRHPGTLRPVHLLPSAFLLTSLALLLGGLFRPLLWAPLALYALLVLADSTLRNRSLRVGLLSVPAAFTQLWGYGSGLLLAAVRRYLLRSGEFQAFETNFYE